MFYYFAKVTLVKLKKAMLDCKFWAATIRRCLINKCTRGRFLFNIFKSSEQPALSLICDRSKQKSSKFEAKVQACCFNLHWIRTFHWKLFNGTMLDWDYRLFTKLQRLSSHFDIERCTFDSKVWRRKTLSGVAACECITESTFGDFFLAFHPTVQQTAA